MYFSAIKPNPDIKYFIDVLTGQKLPHRPLIAEYAIDEEIRKSIIEEVFHETWYQEGDKYWDNFIKIWHRLGYDYVRFEQGLNFQGKSRMAEDTAELTRGKRAWLEEGAGAIQSWEDFEKFNWPRVQDFDFSVYEYIASHRPEGLGFIVSHAGGIYEQVSENALGIEGMCYLLYEQPDLVEAVFSKVGGLINEFYRNLLEIPNIDIVWQGDDMGFKTSTFIAPDLLRKYVFPWHQKYAELAHQHKKPYFLHSCGKLDAVYEDLITTVGIDAKHSFEDAITPVIDFKQQYGQRIGVIGGIDLNKLCIAEASELRAYIRNIQDSCMQGGRYALGSGNTIANYVPLENYSILLEESFAWKG